MRNRIATLHLAAAVLSCATATAATTGVVLDRSGAPVEGAVIRAFAIETERARNERWLAGEAEAAALVTETTGPKGTFTLEVEEPWSRVVIEAPGHVPHVTFALADENIGAIVLDEGVAVPIEVTAAGKAVEGALIVIGDQAAKSGEDGRGEFRAARTSPFTLRIFHSGFAPFVQSYPRAGAVPRSIALSPGVSVEGIVVDAAGNPVAGAVVHVDDLPLATSGDDGSFTIRRAPSDWRSIAAISDDSIAVATRTSKRDALRLVLRKGAVLGGTVTDGVTGRPLSGAAIEIAIRERSAFRMMSEGTSAPDAIAGTDGKWSYGPLPPGARQVMATRIGHAPAYAEVVTTAGKRATRDLAAQPLGRIEGVVLDEARDPVAAAAVTFALQERMPLPMRRTVAWSAPDGSFVLREIATERSVTLEAVRPPAPAAESEALRLEPGEKKRGLTLVIPRGIALTGRVTDANDRPVARAEITAAEADDRGFGFGRVVRRFGEDERHDAVFTDRQGTFTIYLTRGTHDVAVDADGYAAKVLRGVEVVPGVDPLSVVLDEAAAITGRVQRSDGTPVEGASIAAFNMAVPMGGAEQTTTAPDGAFTLGELTPGKTTLLIAKPEELVRVEKVVDAPATDILVEIAAGTVVRGRVVDKETRAPIADFRAGLSGERRGGGRRFVGPPMLREFQTADGAFELSGVPAGSVTLIAEASGYAPGNLTVTVEEGEPLEGVEIPLEPGTRIYGRVSGPDGAPLSGARVGIDESGPRGTRSYNEGTVTDANGEYTLSDIVAGKRVVAATHESFVTDSREVEVAGEEMRVDFRLAKGVELRGVVVRDTGEPVADATVNAMSPAAPFSRGARTDAGGNFVLDGLAPGTYSVNARYESLSETVRDVDPATAGVLRIELKSGGTIAGRVLGLSDDELATTMVLVRRSGASTSVRHDGTFRLEGAPIGSVEVVAMVRGAGGMRSSVPKTVEVTAGGEAWAELDFQSGNEVAGRVTRNGQPVEGARIIFSPKDRGTQSQGSTISGTGGEYAVSGLLDGAYDVRVFDMASATPFVTEYEVRGSGRFDIQFRAGSVTGRVVDASTLEPVEGATVALDGGAGAPRFSGGGTRSDSAGRFILDGVASGQYRLRALKEGFVQETQDVTVVDGEPAEVEVRLRTSPGAELRIVDMRDGRPLAAFLSVADATGQVVYEEYLQVAGGRAHTIPLPPGSYRAIVTAGGYAPVTFDLPAPSGERTIGLGRGGSLRIENPSGQPATVRILDASGQPWRRGSWRSGGAVNLDATGTTIDAIAPGSYALEVLGTNERQPFTIAEGQMTTVRR